MLDVDNRVKSMLQCLSAGIHRLQSEGRHLGTAHRSSHETRNNAGCCNVEHTPLFSDSSRSISCAHAAPGSGGRGMCGGCARLAVLLRALRLTTQVVPVQVVVLRVGPDQQFKTISAALAAALPGSTVLIDAGR